MKHLIIYAHPNKESLNGHFKDTIFEYLQNENHEIVVRDLYQMNFNPVLFLGRWLFSQFLLCQTNLTFRQQLLVKNCIF